MVEILRKAFKGDKADPVFKKLHAVIKQNHVVANHTRRVLEKNKDIKDFCEESTVFVVLPGKSSVFIHYVVASWYSKQGFVIKIDAIGIYDNFMEYEKARLSGLHSADNADIPGIN